MDEVYSVLHLLLLQYSWFKTIRTALQKPNDSMQWNTVNTYDCFISMLHLNLCINSIKTIFNSRTLNLPLLQICKYNITHRLIGSNEDWYHERIEQKYQCLQYICPSQKLSPNPTCPPVIRTFFSKWVISQLMTIPTVFKPTNQTPSVWNISITSQFINPLNAASCKLWCIRSWEKTLQSVHFNHSVSSPEFQMYGRTNHILSFFK